jgi:hypothetical protein
VTSWERALRAWWVAEAGGVLRNLIEWGVRIEAKGRELAFRREEPISDEDERWLIDLDNWHSFCFSKAKRLEDMLFTRQEVDTIRDLLGELVGVCKNAKQVINGGRGRPRKTPISSLVSRNTLEDLAHELQEYNNIQMRLTNRSGIWLLGTVPLEQYTWSAFLNDLDSCFHQLLSWVAKKAGSVAEVAPRVYASTKSMPVAVDCAKAWRSSVEKYREWRLYSKEDYGELAAFVFENKAEFRVGSAAGHATHAEFYPLYARAEYYDVDESVHKVFMKLSEHYGCRVVEHSREEVTVVEIPRSVFVDFFRGVLPFATSMDARLNEPRSFWHHVFFDEYERLKAQGVDPLELEFRLCLAAYDKLKRES